jgi:peroxiredoxin
VASVDSHKKFSDHHDLPQRLLADQQGEVTRMYNARSLFGGSQRAVIVIDRKGVIRYRRSLIPFFRPSDDEVIEAIKAAGSLI